jgi:hypothetical protein
MRVWALSLFVFLQLCGAARGQYIQVVGGVPSSSLVEVVSLDPETNPVPNCLAALNSFPTIVVEGVGAVLGAGNLINKSIPYVCKCLFGLVWVWVCDRIFSG